MQGASDAALESIAADDSDANGGAVDNSFMRRLSDLRRSQSLGMPGQRSARGMWSPRARPAATLLMAAIRLSVVVHVCVLDMLLPATARRRMT